MDEKSGFEKFLTYAVQIVSVAAAVVFGVWAPLSYKATVQGNQGNDATGSNQTLQFDDLNNRLGAIGQLWLYDFCAGQTASVLICCESRLCNDCVQTLPQCNSFTNAVPISSLISYLAQPTVTTTIVSSTSTTSTETGIGESSATSTSSSATATPAPTSAPKLSSTDTIAIALGAVFGGLTILTSLAACFFSRRARSTF